MSVDLTGIYNTSLDTYSDWKPHPDWVTCPDPPVNNVYMVQSDIAETDPWLAVYATTSAGQYAVNWGDGAITYHNSGATAEHQYTSSTGKPCSLGYNTWLVKVWSVSGNITAFKCQKPSNRLSFYPLGLLMVKSNAQYASYIEAFDYLTNGYYNPFLEFVQFPETMINTFYLMRTFYDSLGLKKIVLPKYYNNGSSCINAFYNTTSSYFAENFQNFIISLALGSHTSYARWKLRNIFDTLYIQNSNGTTQLTGLFMYYISAKVVEINCPAVTAAQRIFCSNNVKKIKIVNLSNVTDAMECFLGNYSLKELEGFENLGSTTSDVDMTGVITYAPLLTSPITVAAKCTKLGIFGSASKPNGITSIRLTNPNSPYSGTSPQIDVSYNQLDANALNTLFGDLPTLSGKTIKITGNPGAGTCDTSIATSKGWTVQN